MKTCLTLLLVWLSLWLHAQVPPVPEAFAARTHKAPDINGIPDEALWLQAIPIGGFQQYVPVYNVPARFPSTVRILYDDKAVYIAAFLYDPNPDSILRQLGNRDESNLNADYFAVEFDTYNNQLDAYRFQVFASGVQADSREWDATFDAVWESAVAITDSGWSVEMKIPYSAIRFPKIRTQQWRMELLRSIRRYRELDQWALEVKGSPNDLVYWGKLSGIENVSPALRLSLTPYLTTSWDHSPAEIGGEHDITESIGGGMDLKYGLNESFTLDVSLLPDFSQVQSDNQVKNLSAFEIIYSEQRPFFKEAVDLFGKGDLFYSRRIGRIPMGYFSVAAQLQPGETIIKNPASAQLLNATKLSGRNKKGLAIGLFNAITGHTYATVEDSLSNKRHILTDPRTNYNILVFDQALANNSSLYLINTNVIRDKGYNDANVTGSGVTWFNKSNTFKFKASGAISQIFDADTSQSGIYNTELGYKHSLYVGKVKGKFQAFAYRDVMDHHFSANDLGVTTHNNQLSYGMGTSYNLYEPFGAFRELQVKMEFESERNYLTGKPSHEGFDLHAFTTLHNYLTLWVDGFAEINRGYDYYEPRTAGMFYQKPRYSGIESGFSSDYRKPFALDGRITLYQSDREHYTMVQGWIRPLVRLNDHLYFTHTLSMADNRNDIGYAGTDSLGVVFGMRNVWEVENTFSGRYMFSSRISLNLRARHYWSQGVYHHYFRLQEDGLLSQGITFAENANFNFNSFTVDLVLWWEFAPGSKLNFIWKNKILADDQHLTSGYIHNLKDTWEAPQSNTLTLKILYYLDYHYLKKIKRPIPK